MIRIIRKFMSSVRNRPGRGGFNKQLLEQHRDDAFTALHQQLGGLR